MGAQIDALTVPAIRSRLQAMSSGDVQDPYPQKIFNRPRRRAAVLIPFARVDDRWHLLFIRRTAHEYDHHGGQVAFPGGGMEAGDNDELGTALREANEEIGLAQKDVDILGRLGDVVTITNYHVTPFVALIPWPYQFQPDKNEVARIFTIPLAWLAVRANHELQERQIDGYEPWQVLYFKPYDGETLWGFSAALTVQLLEMLSHP